MPDHPRTESRNNDSTSRFPKSPEWWDSDESIAVGLMPQAHGMRSVIAMLGLVLGAVAIGVVTTPFVAISNRYARRPVRVPLAMLLPLLSKRGRADIENVLADLESDIAEMRARRCPTREIRVVVRRQCVSAVASLTGAELRRFVAAIVSSLDLFHGASDVDDDDHQRPGMT